MEYSIMTKQEPKLIQQRAKDLARLARAIYNAVEHEDNKEWLPLYESLALKARRLFDESSEEDDTFHPDFGQDITDFVGFKNEMLTISPEQQAENERNRSGSSGITPELVAEYSGYVRQHIEDLERRLGIV